jgi:hypothetical protein
MNLYSAVEFLIVVRCLMELKGARIILRIIK